MKILGIESSCDETGLAIYDSATGQLSQRLYSQIEKHREFGGVVPELASRDHVAKAAPLLNDLISEIGEVGDIDPTIVVDVKDLFRHFVELDQRQRNIEAVVRKLVTYYVGLQRCRRLG